MNTTYQGEMRWSERRLLRAWVPAVVLGLTMLVAAACNSGGQEVGPGSTTAQPTGQAPGSTTAQPTGQAPGSTTAQPTGQAPTSTYCQALASLERYRFTAKVTLESPEEVVPVPQDQPTPVPTITRAFEGRFYFEYNVDAALVMPDRADALMHTDTSETLNLITIGDQGWVSLNGQWTEAGPSYTVPYKPLDICNDIFAELNLADARGNEETVNDVPTRHYTFSDTPSGQAIGAIFGPDSDMALLLRNMNVEVWVAEKDGFPVRMDIQSSGVYIDGRQLLAHVRIELRDINNKDIKVEPPI